METTITRLLDAGVRAHTFPGATATVAWCKRGHEPEMVSAAGGALTPGGTKVTQDHLYDLSAITQPIVAMLTMRLIHRGVINVESSLDTWLQDTCGTPTGERTVLHLLRHRSGLAPWGGLYLDVPHPIGSGAAYRWIMHEAAKRMERPPGGEPVQSDLGYLLLGEILMRASGKKLSELLAEEITRPFDIEKEMFYPGALTPSQKLAVIRRCGPTEHCDWRTKVLQGEVHDENAFALGGVAGHAGIFSTSRALARFGVEMIQVFHGESEWLKSAALHDALADGTRDGTPPGEKHNLRTGWKMMDKAAGRRLSAGTFGQTGFTGVSLWCDPQRDMVVSLLSNRVHPGRANRKIDGFRPAFHDAVAAAFDASA